MSDNEPEEEPAFTTPPPAPLVQVAEQGLDDPNRSISRAFGYRKMIDTGYIGLGREFYQIFHLRLYLAEGFSSFDEWLECSFKWKPERAARVRRIWVKFVKELRISPEQVRGVGYSHALALLPVINEKNAEEWFEKARNLSLRAFWREIERYKGPSAEAVASLEAAGIPVIRERAEDDDDLSGEGGFDNIPSGGGGGSLPSERSGLTVSGPSPDRRRPPRDDGVDDAPVRVSGVEVLRPKPTTITLKLNDDQLAVWNNAIEEIQRAKTTEVKTLGECVAHIATEFSWARLTKTEDPAGTPRFYLRTFERVFGGKIVWFQNEEAAQFSVEMMKSRPDLFPHEAPQIHHEKETDADEQSDPDAPDFQPGSGDSV